MSANQNEPNDLELIMVGLSLLLTDAGIKSRDHEFKVAALTISQRLQSRTDELMAARIPPKLNGVPSE